MLIVLLVKDIIDSIFFKFVVEYHLFYETTVNYPNIKNNRTATYGHRYIQECVLCLRHEVEKIREKYE